MGKEKYRKKLNELFQKSPVVSYTSIERLLGDKRKVRGYAKKLIHSLTTQKKIQRLTKGYYTTRNEASFAVFAFQPAYLGLQDAMSFHNLWEQETIPVIITTRKIRPGIRKILGQNVLIRRIKSHYLFGVEYYPHGEIALPYSDVEKTLIDMIYFNEAITQEVIREFKQTIHHSKLKRYLQKYPKRFKEKIISYLK